ncbi:MAG: hypothetical protein U0905_20530 [Pirellulales bacterium]
MIQLLLILIAGLQAGGHEPDAGLFAKSLWFLHAFGDVECVRAGNDNHLKSVLAKAIAKDRELSIDEIGGMISQGAFSKFAGADDRLSESEISAALESVCPASRNKLYPELVKHADLLTTSFDLIAHDHYVAIEQLSDWISENWMPNKTLHILTTCTGNSRRSILGATMGNLAATYYGFDNLEFHSGGTAPSAFNKRTIACLKDIGFQIVPTGKEAERGDPTVPNPQYIVRWGKDLEATEFSKNYKDSSNPHSGFAAILVCNEADAECPVVSGAAIRISMTFLDPKTYDDGLFEPKKYAERRDDIGRTFLAVMAQARSKIQAKISTP